MPTDFNEADCWIVVIKLYACLNLLCDKFSLAVCSFPFIKHNAPAQIQGMKD